MKKIVNYIPVNWFFIASVLIASAISCKKNFNTEFSLPNQFKPGDISITQGETQVVLQWQASLFTTGDSVTYTVEVAKDGTFQSTIDYSVVTDSTAIVLTDGDLEVRQIYYARVKTNAFNTTAESGWVVSSQFQITGEQIFNPVPDNYIKATGVKLTWRPTPDLTEIVLTPNGGGTPVSVSLDATDIANAYKDVTGLNPLTTYQAIIYKNSANKGFVSFTTKELLDFTTTLSPTDNIVDAINAAADGDVIALNPGTYDAVDGSGTFTNITVSQKTITLASVSDDPADTKVNYKEITLKGDGAGIKLQGIEFDGAPATTAGQTALYFLNLTGLNNDADNAVFTNIIVENCRIHNMGNTFLRGNRGGSNGSHKIGDIKVNNSLIYNSAQVNTNYSFFQINKLDFASIVMTNSTLYSIGRAFVDWDANFTTSQLPLIKVQHCTINNLGLANQTFILFDVNGNNVTITMQDCIFGNTPYPGQAVGSLIRADNAMISITYTDYFNLMDGATPTPAPLTIPTNVVLSNDLEINPGGSPGWTAATTDFTLPSGSPLRTASSTGGPIGDLRWAF